ncbi:abortive infection system antitoxin AbiGi family protein [Bacillus wiedmannii]|uniref:abortive infection system antitoxin AbiGi family protein n=1 Tax=Bacillus wiedmannii TaxID=1890302 RepID=UPI0015D4BF89|nr:abortive infection system antitoxin AbiGi family protein [Bacillus wiedmannii]
MIDTKEELKVIKLDEVPTTSKQNSFTRPIQSANVLFKFMGELRFLKEIIEKMAILPRYYEEKIDYLNINGVDKIAFPMSCFCDIHLNKLVPHMENYGYYGIGLSKEWGIQKGIQPIHYINPYSPLREDFSNIFSDTLKQSLEVREKNSSYNNYLLHNLFYMKPLEGDMIVNREYHTRNFHDEREWRFIPNVLEAGTDLPLVLDPEQMNPNSYQVYSNGITKCSNLWLNFELDAIKYIIVKDSYDRAELIKFIVENMNEISDLQKYTLISKVLAFNELQEDW